MLKEWSVRGERKRNPVGVGEKERGERETEMKKRKWEKLKVDCQIGSSIGFG